MSNYGNKGDNALMSMLVRSQKSVCNVKTTKEGHRDRFEMDLLTRLEKIRKQKASRDRFRASMDVGAPISEE